MILKNITIEALETDPVDQAKQILRIMEEVVTEAGPNFIYRQVEHTCHYVRDGQPSCLVGQVLYRVGVPIEGLALREHNGPYRFVDPVAVRDNDYQDKSPYAGYQDDGFPLASATIDILATAQSTQDDEGPWGEALTAARHMASQHGICPPPSDDEN